MKEVMELLPAVIVGPVDGIPVFSPHFTSPVQGLTYQETGLGYHSVSHVQLSRDIVCNRVAHRLPTSLSLLPDHPRRCSYPPPSTSTYTRQHVSFARPRCFQLHPTHLSNRPRRGRLILPVRKDVEPVRPAGSIARRVTPFWSPQPRRFVFLTFLWIGSCVARTQKDESQSQASGKSPEQHSDRFPNEGNIYEASWPSVVGIAVGVLMRREDRRE